MEPKGTEENKTKSQGQKKKTGKSFKEKILHVKMPLFARGPRSRFI